MIQNCIFLWRGLKIFSYFTLGGSKRNTSSERGVQNFCHANLDSTTPYCRVINDQPLTVGDQIREERLFFHVEILIRIIKDLYKMVLRFQRSVIVDVKAVPVFQLGSLSLHL